MPSRPRWAVANGTGVILSVYDEEVARYETTTLTAAVVPALLLPPPTTALLLLGLLEAPPSWAPYALDAAVQLVELLRAAEDLE
ncbi:unnamed protein product [Lactuca virosa]|uniref:Uncharacterized protein n=1 Tax=Lactuca virosa TaxID=75947 RepID=A0AAU9LFK0_9ASTR|nr:unnamed protein product [Lactuca virosa]